MRTETGTKILRQAARSALAALTGLAIVASVLSSVAGATGLTALNTQVTGTVALNDSGAAQLLYAYPPLRMTRYVGDPASGYTHEYQWASPQLVVYPETAPVVIRGTIDVSAQATSSIALVGLLDEDLITTSPGYQSGAYVYVYKRASEVWIGPVDGNYGGEVVQVFDTIPLADITAAGGVVGVRFTVDGTADGDACKATPLGGVPAGATTAGCMTLIVTVGDTTYPAITDSYGELKVRYNNVGGVYSPLDPEYGATEFAGGAVFGWDNSPGVNDAAYDLVVDTDEVAPLVSDVALDPASVYEGQTVAVSANAVAQGANETVKTVEFTYDGGGTWTTMTAGTGSAYSGTFTAPTGAATKSVCVRATDGLSGTTASDERSAEVCSSYVVAAVNPIVTFDGAYYDADGNGMTTLTATVSGGPDAATDGVEVTFDLTPDPAAGDPKAMTDSDGVASVTVALPPGVYDVNVLVADQTNYSYAPGAGVLVVLDPTAASTGGGWYKTGATPPKVNFGYSVQVKVNRRTLTTTISGQMLWINTETVKFKGVVTGYTTPITCPTVGSLTFTKCATVTGVGTVYVWVDPDSGIVGDEYWDEVATDVTYTATVADGGQSSLSKRGGPKLAKPDAFGMVLDGVAYDAEGTAVQLSGGNLVVK